jgi:hypothetical protein
MSLPLGWSFGTAACSPQPPRLVALQQQCVNIPRGVFPTVLMHDAGASGKAHGSKAVILGDYEITGLGAVDDGEVGAVCAFVYDNCLCTLAFYPVSRVADQNTGKPILPAELKHNTHHRAGICIYDHFHVRTSFHENIIAHKRANATMGEKINGESCFFPEQRM